MFFAALVDRNLVDRSANFVDVRRWLGSDPTDVFAITPNGRPQHFAVAFQFFVSLGLLNLIISFGVTATLEAGRRDQQITMAKRLKLYMDDLTETKTQVKQF